VYDLPTKNLMTLGFVAGRFPENWEYDNLFVSREAFRFVEEISDLRLLRLVFNPTNIRLLQLLSKEPTNPRRLALSLGLGESHVSERLRRLGRAGFVKWKWERVGTKNLKIYSLKVTNLNVKLEPLLSRRSR
jgi:predicted transcriptional regulator